MTAGEFYVHPEDRDAFQVAIEEKGFVTGFPVTLKRKDGVQLRCLLTTTLETPSGERGARLPRHHPRRHGTPAQPREADVPRDARSADGAPDARRSRRRAEARDRPRDAKSRSAGRLLPRPRPVQGGQRRARPCRRRPRAAGSERPAARRPARERHRRPPRRRRVRRPLAGDRQPARRRDRGGQDPAGSARLLRDPGRRQPRTCPASIGIALFPDDGESGTHLLQRADAAMYVAKTEGRDGWRRYDRGAGPPSRELVDPRLRERRLRDRRPKAPTQRGRGTRRAASRACGAG